MGKYEKLREAVRNDEPLTGSTLKNVEEDFLANEGTLELLFELCDVEASNDTRWYTLYKITVILKHLCARDPDKLSNLLSEKAGLLNSLRNYTHLDILGRDQGANVRVNIEQLLDFVERGNKFGNRTDNSDSIWTTNENLNSAAERLLENLNSITGVNSQKTVQRLLSDIANLNKYLPGPPTPEKYIGLDKNCRIDGTSYGRLLEKLVAVFDDEFPMMKNEINPIIEKFMVVEGSSRSMLGESLVVLTDALKSSETERVTNCLVIVLEKLIKSDCIVSAITQACSCTEMRSIEREEMESQWQSILRIIVSLPNRIANKLNGKIPNFLKPEIYGKILSFHIARSVSMLRSNLGKFAVRTDPRMLSALISKCLITLGSERFTDLVDIFSHWCSETREDARNLMENIFINVDRSAMEPLAILFLKRSDPSVGIGRVFENFLTNAHWKYVFLKKIPLVSYYENDNVVLNLVAYLADSGKEQRILQELVTRLLDIWGDESALNHTWLEQQVYITKLILTGMRRLKKCLTTTEKEEAKRLLFAGISTHLKSTQAELRGIGMITGEIVVDALNESADEPKLRYEYEGMPARAREIVQVLRNFENCDVGSKDPSGVERVRLENEAERRIGELAMDGGIVARNFARSNDLPKITEREISEEKLEKVDGEIRRVSAEDSDDNLDSDDDLIPYDMSNDTPISEKLRPTYLRDLMENLLDCRSNENPDIFAESMRISEDLILSQLPKDDSSLGIALLEIFLKLREKSYLENFELLKFKACVSIVMVFPKESAKYLCEQFHAGAGEYSINDRLFVLDVLGESARRLSKIDVRDGSKEKTRRTNEKGTCGKETSLAIDTENCKKYETLYDDDFEVSSGQGNERSYDWQEIVARRIESNTRRFAHPTKLPSATMNKFNDAASSFFYPLLYGFRRRGILAYDPPSTFQDQGNILLVHYLKTLSRITLAAENCIVLPKMAKEIMDLAWTLRYHDEAKVRLGVIENIASVVAILPREALTGELMDSIFEFRGWLADVSEDGIRGDPDSDCRNLGKNVVALLDSLFRSSLNAQRAV